MKGLLHNILPLPVHIIVAALATFTNAQDTSWDVTLIGASNPWEGIITFQFTDPTDVTPVSYTVTICADQWDIVDADVVCRQLGWPGAKIAITLDRVYNKSSIYSTSHVLMNVQCSGRETSLAYCPGRIGSKYECSPAWYQAGVVCNTPQQTAQGKLHFFNVRLSGGSGPYEGIVEIYYKGEWNFVCIDLWDMSDGYVVCKQLGYVSAIYTGSLDSYKLYSNPFLPIDWSVEYESRRVILDNVRCTGQETNLGHCPALFGTNVACTPFGSRREPAILQCKPPPASIQPPKNLRLYGGSNEREGQVEVYFQGQWGTVCDDLWGVEEGEVVCRQLGFGSLRTTNSTGESRKSRLPIVLENVECYGYEASLNDCDGLWITIGRDNDYGCSRPDPAGVSCFANAKGTPPPTPAPSETVQLYGGLNEREGQVEGQTVQLYGGSNKREGQVEVYYQGQWGAVCNDLWGVEEGEVVCRQLGFGSLRSTSYWSFQNPNTGESRKLSRLPIVVNKVECYGHEVSLNDCGGLWGSAARGCFGQYPAGVSCYANAKDIPEIRLKGGKFPNQGRVEMFLHGEWGTICGDPFDMNAGNVVCRQLGFSRALEVFQGSSGNYGRIGNFGQSYGVIHLDDVVCPSWPGDEQSIYFCEHAGVGVHDCSQDKVAGVLCESNEYPNTTEPAESEDWNYDGPGSIVMAVLIPACVILVICFLCYRACEYNTERNPPTNIVNRPALESGNANTAPATTLPLLTAGGVPSGPADLPPAYDSVMQDPNKLAFPPGTNGGATQIPLTPPPEYSPPTVVFNVDTNSVNVTTSTADAPDIIA